MMILMVQVLDMKKQWTMVTVKPSMTQDMAETLTERRRAMLNHNLQVTHNSLTTGMVHKDMRIMVENQHRAMRDPVPLPPDP